MVLGHLRIGLATWKLAIIILQFFFGKTLAFNTILVGENINTDGINTNHLIKILTVLFLIANNILRPSSTKLQP